jgi:hypothetical protein
MADQKAIIERHPFDLLALLSLIHKYSYGIHKVSTHVTDIVTQILSNCDDAESNTWPTLEIHSIWYSWLPYKASTHSLPA